MRKPPQIPYESPPSLEERRRRRRASGFVRNEQSERLIEMAQEGEQLSAAQRMQIGYYEQAKAAAEAEGFDTTGDDAA